MLSAMVTLATGLAARVTKAAASATGDGHASLYETCAALIIAVLVVFYFDERVRRTLTARIRGYAIGSLGGVIGTGLLSSATSPRSAYLPPSIRWPFSPSLSASRSRTGAAKTPPASV